MPLDEARIYRSLDDLNEKVTTVLVELQRQNGNVNHNARCISANSKRLDEHAQTLSRHGTRLGQLEKSEALGGEWLSEFRRETRRELEWSRAKIIDTLVKVLPWIGLLGFIAKDIL